MCVFCTSAFARFAARLHSQHSPRSKSAPVDRLVVQEAEGGSAPSAAMQPRHSDAQTETTRGPDFSRSKPVIRTYDN
jgi:hypothetical protein